MSLSFRKEPHLKWSELEYIKLIYAYEILSRVAIKKKMRKMSLSARMSHLAVLAWDEVIC